jgi:hypothetical protein
VVQMYLMNNFDFHTKNADGKTSKDVWKDPNILALFERFEKWFEEGKSNTTKVEDTKESIKEENDEDEESCQNLQSTEVTYKFDVDKNKNEEDKDGESKNLDEKEQPERFIGDTKQWLILESEVNHHLFEKEEYLQRVLNIIDEFKDNV